MSMPLPPPQQRRASPAVRAALRPALACVLGIATALLIAACGSSGKGLIAASEAGPLKSDIEAVDLAAQEGNGNCTATDAALQRTEQDYTALPTSIDAGLHNTLRQGISNLRKVATELCAQPIAKATTTATTPTITTPAAKTTTPSEEKAKEREGEEKVAAKEREKVEKTKEEESGTTPGTGGGTPAPGEGNGKSPGAGAGGAGAEETPPAGGSETK
jgi:hypothetical protein